MPELPEVEVTRLGIEPHVVGRTSTSVLVREPRLRWRVPQAVRGLAGRVVQSVKRRGKYLLLDCGDGHLILHLGMSGSLRLVAPGRIQASMTILTSRLAKSSAPARSAPLRRRALDHATARGTPLIRHLGVEPLSQR
jgi:formamidopyrimidine-DNA glycosylase